MTKEVRYLLLIVVIFIAACIETDIYLPAFPDMMVFFSAPEEVIQSLLTWNFFGICVSGPFYGPISDAFGRRKPLLIALGIFLIGSIITLFANTFPLMLWGRLLQGLGSGGCFTLGTAIIFDAFQAEQAVKAISKLNATIPFIMALAPMAGGYLNYAYGFRSNFLTITLFVLASFLICLFFYDETLAKEKRTVFSVQQILRDFGRAFSCLAFWQVTLVTSLTFAGYLAFVSGSAVLFVLELGVSKKMFPFFQASVLIAYLLACIRCNKLIDTWGSTKVKRVGIALTVAGGFGFGIAAWFAPSNPYLLTAPMLLYAFGLNWITALYFPEGMEVLPDIKGITASLMTSARLLLTAAIVGVTSAFYNATIYPLAIAIVLIMLVVLPTIYFYETRKSLII